MCKLTENAEMWAWVAFLDWRRIFLGVAIFTIVMSTLGIWLAARFNLIP